MLEGVASNAITAEDFISLDYDLSELIDQNSTSQNIDLNLLNKLDQEDSSDDPSEDDSQDKPADDTDDDLPVGSDNGYILNIVLNDIVDAIGGTDILQPDCGHDHSI